MCAPVKGEQHHCGGSSIVVRQLERVSILPHYALARPTFGNVRLTAYVRKSSDRVPTELYINRGHIILNQFNPSCAHISNTSQLGGPLMASCYGLLRFQAEASIGGAWVVNILP